MNSISNTEPRAIRYMPLDGGKADVWLHKNITKIEYKEQPFWQCDEVYMRTYLTREEIEARFDELFAELEKGEIPLPTPEERIQDLQAQIEEQAGAIEELASMLAGGE